MFKQIAKARRKVRRGSVAQWIEQCSSKALMLVRFQPGPPRANRSYGLRVQKIFGALTKNPLKGGFIFLIN